MLTENDVVEAVITHLKDEGWFVIQRATTSQHGPDILTERDGRHLMVEAKGATSSKEWTARFTKPFAGKQVRTHIAVALYTCLRWRDDLDHAGHAVAIALPDTSTHRTKVGHILGSLDGLGIRVFWVAEDGTVS